MPKSRNRRKKPRKARPTARAEAARSPNTPDSPASSDSTVARAVEPRATASKERRSIRERLYNDDARGLVQLLTIAPLFVGSWVAGGVVIKELNLFVVLTSGVLLQHFRDTIREREDIPFVRELTWLVIAAQVALVFQFYAMTGHPRAAILFACVLLLQGIFDGRRSDTPLLVVLHGVALVVHMTLAAVLGMFGQGFRTQPQLILEFGVLGFVPATLLAASLIARRGALLDAAGWTRIRSTHRNKKSGEEVARPGPAAALFGMLLVLGPAVAVAVVPLGLLPYSFLLCGVVFRWVPHVAEHFLHRREPDREIAIRAANLAGLATILVIIAGTAARYL